MKAASRTLSDLLRVRGVATTSNRRDATAPIMLQKVSRHSTLGALLIGSWTNYMLFTLELALIWRYLTLFPRRNDDAVWIRVLVLSMLVLDIATTADLSFLVYWQCVSTWGGASSFVLESAITIAYGTMTAASAFCMQAFLINRYCLLSRNYVLTTFFALCAITTVVGTALTISISVGFITSEERATANTYVCVWFGGSFATDVLIAMGLAWEFWRATPLKQTTKSLLRRLICNTILCGALTACLAAVVLINFLVFPKNYNYATMVGSNMGRICTLTVVYNLNFRHTGRDMVRVANASNMDFLNPQVISLVNPDQRFKATEIAPEAQELPQGGSAPGESGVISEPDATSGATEPLAAHQSQSRPPDLHSGDV